MKYMFLIALVAFSAQEVLMYSSMPLPCSARSCSTEFEPVCGKQKNGDCWEVKIFNNTCMMEEANDCDRAFFIPCVENMCGKPLHQ